MTEPRYPLPHRYDNEDDYADAVEAYYKRLDAYEEWAENEVERQIEERDRE
jgi:hypothetical protein